jgi:hypothetical protein
VAYDRSVHRAILAGKAASQILEGQPIALIAEDSYAPPATFTAQVIGVARQTASIGQAVEAVVDGVVRCVAGASLGAGARVGLASGVGSAGGLVPLVAGVTASQIGYTIGRSLEAAAAGSSFNVLIDPGQVL